VVCLCWWRLINVHAFSCDVRAMERVAWWTPCSLYRRCLLPRRRSHAVEGTGFKAYWLRDVLLIRSFVFVDVCYWVLLWIIPIRRGYSWWRVISVTEISVVTDWTNLLGEISLQWDENRPRAERLVYWCHSVSSFYGCTALVDLDRFFSFLILTQSVGLLGRGVSLSQGHYLHTE
jgi:hypothetical protein